MRANIDLADVPAVEARELHFVMDMLIRSGQGLALLRGLKEEEIRSLETRIWTDFEGSDVARLAVALRFRALLDVFASRRLKALFLDRGFRLLTSAALEAAQRPLNIRFGFNAQQLLLALNAETAPLNGVREDTPLAMAA
ncbi:hypothetical protein [Hyphomicrobium sp. ghe19]|uniref:hypothetical protein n=1 Tax=Hyphomicrobium sp. ghe19 TaxID=2682968 RepID=UPI001366DA7A|nr:hypothetical protein HYPP_02928 [Hyphomicrobium sp. ghe19]